MLQVIFSLVIISVLLIELSLIHELGKKDSKVRNLMNKIEFEMDREKYVAYALRRNTLAWKRIEDIPKEHKATSINLEDENSRYIVTQDIFKADEEYCKLYVIKENEIQIMYIKKETVCKLEPFKVW